MRLHSKYIVSFLLLLFYQSGQLARSSMKCVAFITPAVTVIAHSRSAECRLPVCQTACYAEQPGPLCSTTAALHIVLHSIAYRPPVVALSVQRAAAAASMSWEQMLQLCSQSSAALLPAMELSRLLLLADATIYSSSFSSSRFTHSIAAPCALLLPPPSPQRRRRLADSTTCTE